MKKIVKIVAIIATVLSLMTMTGCGVSTQQSVTKVQVGAGPFDDPVVKDCIKPGTRDNSPTNDDYYSYPVSDRDLDATGQSGSDFKSITAVSKDNAEMAIPLIIRFNMVTDCDTLGEFFKKYGQRYGAYLNDDGTTTDGWMLMLRKLMYDPTDALLDDVAKNYNWRDLYNNAKAQQELQTQLSNQIQSIVDTNARGHYFEHFTVLVKKPTPTNGNLATAIADEQAAVASAATAEAKAKAQKAQAEAETALARAEAAKKRAEIAGYGGFENYNKAQAVNNGLNPYQPTYIVSGTK